MLPDHVAPGLDILFCGTAPGQMSADRGHYYARPGNRFWALLAETGLTPRRLAPDEDSLLPGFGLGLTDLAQGVAGQDADIPPAAYAPARLAALVARVTPRALAFTSLNAARRALGNPRLGGGRLAPDPRFGETLLWALPSPSGLARSHFSAQPWQELSAWRRSLR
ncbi:MAG: mismatch-specific DNA-glycosylase [Pseudorhodobacter sp.]|nr:mismatch-specific DNA-glycosylase [Pseudorhodobacter sp.]